LKNIQNDTRIKERAMGRQRERESEKERVSCGVKRGARQ
jgi:hypothetical protein